MTAPHAPSPKKRRPSIYMDGPLIGVLCALGACIMFALMNMFAKILSENHHVIEISFYRNIIALTIFSVIIWRRGGLKTAKLVNKNGTVLRALIGVVSLAVTFAAYTHMPMADVTALLFTASLIVPVLSILFLGEHVGRHRWTAIILGFIGVLIMLQPTGNTTLIGISLALGAATIHAIMAVLLRHIGRTDGPITVTFYFLLYGAVITGLALPFLFVMPTMAELPYIIGIGFSGALAQLCLATAFRHIEASAVSVFNYSSIIWATIIGYFVWGDIPPYTIIFGGTIVISCNIYIVWRERQLHKKSKLAQLQKDELTL